MSKRRSATRKSKASNHFLWTIGDDKKSHKGCECLNIALELHCYTLIRH